MFCRDPDASSPRPALSERIDRAADLLRPRIEVHVEEREPPALVGLSGSRVWRRPATECTMPSEWLETLSKAEETGPRGP